MVFWDNVEFVSEFQASLNIIEVKLDEISDQIEVVDEKLDIVDDKIEEGFENLDNDVAEINEITKENSEMLNTISYQQEEVLTSIESLNNIGNDLKEMLSLKTIVIGSNLKSKIESQLKSEAYNKVFNHYNKRYVDYDYQIKTEKYSEDFTKIAIEQVPNTDIERKINKKLNVTKRGQITNF